MSSAQAESLGAYWRQLAGTAKKATRRVQKEHPGWSIAMTAAAVLASGVIGWLTQPDLGIWLSIGAGVGVFLGLVGCFWLATFLVQLVKAPWRRAVEVEGSYRQHVVELEKALLAAKRKAKTAGKWDTDALGIKDDRLPAWDRGKTRYSLKFWVYAKKPIRQPNRLRLEFTEKPQGQTVLLYTGETNEDGEELPVFVGSQLGEVEVVRKRMEISFHAPALAESPDAAEGGHLLVLVWSDSEFSIDRTAALA